MGAVCYQRFGCADLGVCIQRVALILTRTHHASTIGRVDFSAEPSVRIMRYGSITLKSAVRGCLRRVSIGHQGLLLRWEKDNKWQRKRPYVVVP